MTCLLQTLLCIWNCCFLFDSFALVKIRVRNLRILPKMRDLVTILETDRSTSKVLFHAVGYTFNYYIVFESCRQA